MRTLAVVASVLLVGACGVEDRMGAKDAGGDVPFDSGIDAGIDAEIDARQDVVEEAVGDAGGELGVDVAEEVVEQFPPRGLPFKFTRPQDGEPIPESEVAELTKKVTGLWKKTDHFRWLLRTSTGVDPSTGKDDYLAWYNDIHAVKAGDTVTFQQKGGDHNMWIPGSRILSEAIGGCALTGDWTVCKVAEQYCKGLTAVVKGFIWDENDPAPFLMARAVFPMDQSFTLDEETWKDDGRKKAMEFHDMYHIEDGWNAHTFEWPHNPTWGYMWVTNMRSKDDVCAIVRTTVFLPYIIADAPYDWVRDACQETMDNMVGFNKDIVDSGYNIRTKDADGKPRLVTEEDLGNYTSYSFIDEKNECTNRLASDLIAYGKPLTNDCGSGWGSVYDRIAPSSHYYNYPIIWNYHMAALGNALVYGHNEIAKNLLEGLAERIDAYLAPDSEEPGATHSSWHKDMAVLLVQAASVGLPLTANEARLVHKQWLQAVTEFESWPNWDLWAPSVPDGEYPGSGGVRPSETDAGIPVEAVAMFLEYCNSPFRNPAGASFVDCTVVADTSTWGLQ